MRRNSLRRGHAFGCGRARARAMRWTHFRTRCYCEGIIYAKAPLLVSVTRGHALCGGSTAPRSRSFCRWASRVASATEIARTEIAELDEGATAEAAAFKLAAAVAPMRPTVACSRRSISAAHATELAPALMCVFSEVEYPCKKKVESPFVPLAVCLRTANNST